MRAFDTIRILWRKFKSKYKHFIVMSKFTVFDNYLLIYLLPELRTP